ncbi:hypothetical protein JCM33374_g4145 [Metschnikowia sp. JCM 33374]|nr:hypothetical protein JCM33374_g4145 [Metschnikowia sp. JCM 33374]
MLLASAQAVSSSILSPTPSSARVMSTSSKSTGLSMITLPVVIGDYGDFELGFQDGDGEDIRVSYDYLQQNLWLVNSDVIMPCPAVQPFYSMYNYTYLPDVVTYDGATYNPNECYNDGAYVPKTIVTRSNGSSTSTVTQAVAVPTTSPYNITYPYIFYASGYFTNGNFSFYTLSANPTIDAAGSLDLSGIKYLSVNDTNAPGGMLGLAGPSLGGGFLETLKSKGLIYGSGYSAYYFYNASYDDVGGYLLLGSVDQKLYTGNLYSFPRIPHVGWGDPNLMLPIIQLDSVKLSNLQTSQPAKIYTGPVPVMFDTTFDYSYLPREFMISLALQTNAYYAFDYSSWIVNCTAVNNANATLQFNFGPLNVNVPLSSIIVPAGSNWTFADGSPACTFNMLPAENIGFAVFGTTFLPYIYMAMDNEGGRMAVANANTLLNSSSSYTAGSSSNTTTVGYIRSGSIPFTVNAQVTPAVTFTFGTVNYSSRFSDPGLLTNIMISSGHVFISQRWSSLRSTAAASAASPKSTMGGAGSFKASLTKGNGSVFPLILLLGGIMGVMFI